MKFLLFYSSLLLYWCILAQDVLEEDNNAETVKNNVVLDETGQDPAEIVAGMEVTNEENVVKTDLVDILSPADGIENVDGEVEGAVEKKADFSPGETEQISTEDEAVADNDNQNNEYVVETDSTAFQTQDEVTQDHNNEESVEKPLETEQIQTEGKAFTENEVSNHEYVVETDSTEIGDEVTQKDYNNEESVKNPVETEQIQTEGEAFTENVDSNNVYVVEADSIEIQAHDEGTQNYNHEETVENPVETEQIQNEGEELTGNLINDHVDKTDSPEIQAENEMEQDNTAEVVENNVVQSPIETEQNPTNGEELTGNLINGNEHVDKTDSTEIQAQNEMEQDNTAEVVENNVVHSPIETEQNPTNGEQLTENEMNSNEQVFRTDFTQIQAEDELQQDINAEDNGNADADSEVEMERENHGETVSDHEVADDIGIDPAKTLVQEDIVYTPTENEQSSNEVVKEHPVGTDSIEILGLPSYILHPNLRSTVRYSIAGARTLVIDIYGVSTDGVQSIYHTEWTEMFHYPGETKVKVLRVTLPDNMVYKEDRILNISPDLHTESLLVRAAIVDYENPSVLLVFAEHPIALVTPWSRPPKYSGNTCNSWIGMLFKNLSRNRIPKCSKIDDVVELLPFPVALLPNEHGYKKFLPEFREPEAEINSSAQFTLATWLYLTNGCSNDMCPLLYHIKGTAYQTPLVGLLKSGHLHLQFHNEDGSGHAFVVDAQIRVHKWMHITVTVKNTVVYVYVRHGQNLQFTKTFVHSDFPAGSYHYNDTDGYWGVGGSPGFISARGFIGPARIYRRQTLSQEAVGMIFTSASRPNLGISAHFKACRKLRSWVKFLLRKMIAKKRSYQRGWAQAGPASYCNVGARGLAAEIVQTLIETLNINETTASDLIQDKVYQYAFNLIKNDADNDKDALFLLSFSCCLGHPQSLYLRSLLYRTGLGVSVDPRVAQRSLLLGALYNHPLSHMSLAYKHYIGVDGLPKDHEVASTYYRNAAVQSNRVLAEHNEVHTHSEAVRLDKKEELENYRGPHSNWFSWFKHQALRGVIDAQSALGEVFYYGSRGFRRNLTKAAEFYEMGANRGDAQMLFNLGVVKLRGQGVEVNVAEARDLLKKSAELGFAPAYNALGYYELNVRQNKSGAVGYFRLAAEHQDKDGLYNLGFALENGLAPGTEGDLRVAMPYYISAANKGHSGACVVAGDAFSLGRHVERDVRISIIFYKFVADQIPEIGLHLRNGLDGYFEKSWYQSLLHYLLAAEAGMEIAQYNAALLCEWDWQRVSRHSQVDCAWRYYGHSAKLEWVPSLIKTGDNHWYGITAEKNITAAARLYSQAATKEQNPQAIYNLGYLVENNYPLDGLTWMHFHPTSASPGNLTLAAAFYRKCRDVSDEALVPCSLGLVRVAVKMAWQLELVKSEIILIPFIISMVGIAFLYYLSRLNSDHQMIDLT